MWSSVILILVSTYFRYDDYICCNTPGMKSNILNNMAPSITVTTPIDNVDFTYI